MAGMPVPGNNRDLGPIKPYPIHGDKCRDCGQRRLRLIHDSPLREGGKAVDTLVCEACDTPDSRFTLTTLGLDTEREDRDA